MNNKRYTDKELESIWQELEDIPVYENENFELCLDVDWQGWSKGTDVDTIWHWFDEQHSKGVGWLMNEYKRQTHKSVVVRGNNI